jgi:hypothetical protein
MMAVELWQAEFAAVEAGNADQVSAAERDRAEDYPLTPVKPGNGC